MVATRTFDRAKVTSYRAEPLNPARYPRWRAALSRLRRNTGGAKLMVYGDSNDRGALATGIGVGNAMSQSWPTQFARDLVPQFIPGREGSWGSVFGDAWKGNNASTGLQVEDTRVTFTGAWTTAAQQQANSQTFGGVYWNASAAGSMTFTPTEAVDSFKIYYFRNTGLGTFGWSVDGGSVTNISQNGAVGVQVATVSAGAAGAHALKLEWVSGALAILGIEGVNSTKNVLTVYNGGAYGINSTFGAAAGNTFSPGNSAMMDAITPDLIMLPWGINDELQSIPIATTQANFQAVITKAKARTYDVILKMHIPCSTLTATQQATLQMMYDLAETNNIDVINCFDRWGSNANYSALNALGYYADTNHPLALGYGDIAALCAEKLLSI